MSFTKENKNNSELITSDPEFINFIQQLSTTNQFVLKTKDLNQGARFAKYISQVTTITLQHKDSQENVSKSMLEMAINELIINAIEHGLLKINYEQKKQLLEKKIWNEYIFQELAKLNQDQFITIECKVNQAFTIMQVSVTDPGKGFSIDKYSDNVKKDLERSSLLQHGRGIIMTKFVLGADNLKYHYDQSRNSATFKLQISYDFKN